MDEAVVYDFPRVSIVIPAYNAQDTIAKCLESLKLLDYPRGKLEVIVVDNGSLDNTKQIVKRFVCKVLSLPDGNVGAVRNFGAKNARGEILAHTDSDCVLPRHWLIDAVRMLELDKHIGAVGGGCLVPKDATLLERAWVSVQKEDIREVAYLPACNFILRKSLFDLLGGFNEDITAGEDDDLSISIAASGCRLISLKDCYVYHLGYPKTLMAVSKRQIWHGKSALALLSKSWKLFVVTIIFFLAILSPIILVLFKNQNVSLWVLDVFFIISMPLLLALKKMRGQDSVKLSYFLPLVGICFFFLVGRCLGFLWGTKCSVKNNLSIFRDRNFMS